MVICECIAVLAVCVLCERLSSGALLRDLMFGQWLELR